MDYRSDKGLAILLPKIAQMRQSLEQRLTKMLERHYYLPLYTPHIGKIELFQQSGHYPYYKDSMFAPLRAQTVFDKPGEVVDTQEYLLKPMNCPFHIEAYMSEPRSYKDLPLRYYEFGTVYRNEDSGAINGLYRLRGFTQDDGHIFCREDQIGREIALIIGMIKQVGIMFGLKITHKVSIRGDEQDKYIGDKELWEKAEAELMTFVPEGTEVEKGGAAFYGPKIDFTAKDKLGRDWQLGTVQLDFTLPERFDLRYHDADNNERRPVMIHRALLGSLERFIAILLDNDTVPVWMRLEQVRVIPVHEDQLDYAKHVSDQLRRNGIRAKPDKETAPLRAKIKNAILDKVPIQIIVGKEEKEKLTVTVQTEGQKETVLLQAFIDAFEVKLSNLM